MNSCIRSVYFLRTKNILRWNVKIHCIIKPVLGLCVNLVIITTLTCFLRADLVRQYAVHTEFQLLGTIGAVHDDVGINAIHLFLYGFQFIRSAISHTHITTRKHAFCVRTLTHVACTTSHRESLLKRDVKGILIIAFVVTNLTSSLLTLIHFIHSWWRCH